ncbi:hypothetical protein Tco_1479746 [Tanacetum coccineum]
MVIPNEPIPQRTSLGGRPQCQYTILGDTDAQIRFETASKQSYDPPLSRVNTLGSSEDRLKLMELIKLYTKLSDRVLDLETTNTTQAKEIVDLKKRVKKLERKRKSRTPGRNLFKIEDAKTQRRYGHNIDTARVTTASTLITTVGVSVSTVEPKKTKERESKEKSSDTATKPTRGVTIQEPNETVSRPIVPPQQQLDPKDKGKGIMQEPEKPMKMKGKDQIAFDKEVARRLEAQLQAELEKKKELQDKEKKRLT